MLEKKKRDKSPFTSGLIVFIFFLNTIIVLGQERVTLSGYVTDITTNETLIGVSIIFPELKQGTVTNEYGFYSITIPKGNHNIIVSYLGFNSYDEPIKLDSNLTKNFELFSSTVILEEVEVVDNEESINLKSPQMSVNRLSIETIKNMPATLGEVDIVKSITLLPGVTNAGEGASGFNVRGGAADQNLILLDEAIIFNSSHLFGFFSVFNPDAIKDIKLYKGGIPSNYGGRVSSVLNIYQKEGNSKKLKANGGIGLISSRLLVEGPLEKDKGAFLLGGRSSYVHLFLPLIESIADNKAYFYDLNTKLSYTLNEKNKIFLSGYFGRDVFDINNLFNNAYGNSVANFRWNHLFSQKLFSNLSLIYSDYDYFLDFNFADFKWTSGIVNFNLKYDFKHYLNENTKLGYGLNHINYKFDPGLIEPSRENTQVNTNKLTNKFALENAIYANVETSLSKKINFMLGIRLSNFIRLGQPLFVYENNEAVLFNPSLQIYESAVPLREENYSKNKVLKNFFNFEPRFSVSFQSKENESFKLSYNRMAQYLHLISNTNTPTPIDIWAPSGRFIDPQLLNQFAVGYFKSIQNNRYNISLEAFYKDIQNRLDYIDGAELIANNTIEQVLLRGQSEAKGIEFLLRKNDGKLTGWVAYTLSRSLQQTQGRTPQETGIANGSWYFTPFDKTHDISLTASYQGNSRWRFNTNFLFQSGQPITYPNGQYTFMDFSIPNYETRNSSRLPSYHRLDLSASYTPNQKQQKSTGEWVFSIFNVYNRKNAASLRFEQNRETGQNEAIRLSIFGIIPSVTYNFKF